MSSDYYFNYLGFRIFPLKIYNLPRFPEITQWGSGTFFPKGGAASVDTGNKKPEVPIHR